MATKVLMPQLGESVTEGTITKWLVKVGDVVAKYDPLAEVSTDKVNAEVPSTVAGRVTEIVVPEGETVAVGTLILYIEESGEQAGGAVSGAAPGEGTAAAEAKPAQTAAAQADATPTAAGAQTGHTAASDTASAPELAQPQGQKQRYSPAVMRLAQEHGIDLSRVRGTGMEGRVTRKDIQAIIDAGAQEAAPAPAAVPAESTRTEDSAAGAPARQPAAAAATASVKADIPVGAGDQIIPVTPIRRTIANRMVQSKHEAPHAWTMVEVDVTRLVDFRNQVKDSFKQKEGVNLTFLPFFIKAVVEALKEYPILNSTWAGDQIIVKKNINISIAVATEDALYVPVIKDADQKSIFGIAKSIEELAAKTRAGKLTVDDMTGGTFTVNNTGSFGSVLSMPIINSPQAAILSVESIVKRPVVIDDMIAIRSMVNLCLSLDHRVLDGLVCGRFLQSVKQKLEAIGPDTKLY
ncbi:2-oxo acid dehydrogenase subunit E2 [Brevibacillus composti]|uniref:Dihydrolipoamide acetyltransferase component of pyruvate dehydrogenase complex n=1 Tax=Brevibacillus composti TaxID=2796470 RepID=A0A7T5EHV7_9BACL|nr:dihydrolipoamide acetyltransferase family protein [Brevibacillus composti]QQE72860.1 2-oxo acid dehydrogenase subunit E2 [Brevibacillus composti]QUO39938.1 2-oxo acid dehydrogenase subunit E2 [Brevibacillus composti]